MEHTSSRAIKIIAVLIAIVLIATVTFVIYDSRSPAGKSNKVPKSASFGPKIDVSVGPVDSATSGDQNSGIVNNTSITLQIFSVVPSLFSGSTGSASLINANISDNSYYVELLNTTLNSSRATVFLSPLFVNISREWNELFSKMEGRNYPSLSVDAYKTVIVNSTVQIYKYYNNIEYNPEMVDVSTFNNIQSGNTVPDLESYFNGTGLNLSDYSSISITDLSFTLNITFPDTPYQTLTNVTMSSGKSDGSPFVTMTGSSGCITTYRWDNYSSTYDSVTGINTTEGYLPLLALHMGRATAESLSLISLGGTLTLLNNTIGINSAEPYVSSSGEVTTQMSTNPSFAVLANASVASSSKTAVAYPPTRSGNQTIIQNRTTGFVAIDNATYTFTHFNQYTTYYHKYYEIIICYRDGDIIYSHREILLKDITSTTLDGHGTIGGISYINSKGGLKMAAGFLPVEVNMVIQKLLEKENAVNLPLNVSGNTSSYDSSTVWSYSYGYTDASNVIKSVSDALHVFSTSLALGLAISDTLAALNEFFDAAEPEIVDDSISMISEAIGMTADVLGLFSTISFVSGTYAAIVDQTFSNYPMYDYPGSNLQLSFYQSSTPLTFDYNGNVYSFYAPEDYGNSTAILQN
ncbi:MAG: hypothetical protein M1402_04710 [Candidatus Thermoplasmatota archaeon]|nr:hypothetical protein [Candidatus Thermoplasmatota archaeon]